MLKSSIDLSQGDCVKIKYKLNSNEFSTFFSFILLSRYTIVKYRVFRADLINLFVFIELFMRIRRIFQLKQLNFNVTNKRFHFDPPDTFLFSLSSKFKLEKSLRQGFYLKSSWNRHICNTCPQALKHILGLLEMSKSYLTINKASSRVSFFVGFRNLTFWLAVILSMSPHDKQIY